MELHEEYLKHVDMEVSEDIKKFVDDAVFRNSEYLFVSKDGNRNIGYCTYCNHEYEVEKLTHNERGICPACGASITAKLTRYRRKSCLNESCFYFFEKSVIDSNVVICKGYYVAKDYSKDYKKPEYEYNLQAVYVFQDKKAVMLTKNWWYKSWDKRASIYDFNTGWLAPKMCHCSFESIGEAITGTSFQYLPYKHFEGHYSMTKLFEEYTKHPWIEQICKIGFEGIIEYRLLGKCLYDCLNYKGKNVFKVLRLSRKDVKEIRNSNIDITPLFLKLYQLQIKDNSGFTPWEVESIERTYGSYYSAMRNITKYISMKKAIKYIEKQYEKYKKQHYSKSDYLVNWNDYIDGCLKLEMDLKDEHVLFPKDVYKAHQNIIKQIKVKANEILDNKINKRIPSLEKYIFQYGDYLVRPAMSTTELIEEGKKLNHCVATHYTEPYANGKTNIFFVRKILNPEKPFCTVEVKDNIVRQAYIKNDKVPNKETLEFIEAFKKARLEKKSKIKTPA